MSELRVPPSLGPAQVLFVRGVGVIAETANAVEKSGAGKPTPKPEFAGSRCSRALVSSVALKLRSVASESRTALRTVASAYRSSVKDPRTNPRSVLSSTFQTLRRTARTKKCQRLAERFAAAPKRFAYGATEQWVRSQEGCSVVSRPASNHGPADELRQREWRHISEIVSSVLGSIETRVQASKAKPCRTAGRSD